VIEQGSGLYPGELRALSCWISAAKVNPENIGSGRVASSASVEAVEMLVARLVGLAAVLHSESRRPLRAHHRPGPRSCSSVSDGSS